MNMTSGDSGIIVVSVGARREAVMANKVSGEYFKNCVIDVEDMTITEFDRDGTRTYSLLDALKRWSGLPEVNLSIERIVDIPPENEG